jgi:hypothetical protein
VSELVDMLVEDDVSFVVVEIEEVVVELTVLVAITETVFG